MPTGMTLESKIYIHLKIQLINNAHCT